MLLSLGTENIIRVTYQNKEKSCDGLKDMLTRMLKTVCGDGGKGGRRRKKRRRKMMMRRMERRRGSV